MIGETPTSHKSIISLDLGGTRIRAARLDENLNMLARRETLTLAEQGFEPVMSRIKDLIRAVLPADGSSVMGIGIAVPGMLNPATGILASAENLPGWRNVPVVSLLQETFGVPVYLINDANAAALGETVYGAARGFKHVIYLTLSTGIGGGIITDGKLLLGRDGMAAEVGFLYLVIGGKPVIWQDKASGLALAQEARARITNGEKSLMWSLVDGAIDKIDGNVIGEAARQSDALALDIVYQAGALIGLGIASLVHLFNPQIVVLGGGLTALGERLFAPMRETLNTYAVPEFLASLHIVEAALKDDAGLIGAAASVITEGGCANVVDVSEKLRKHHLPGTR